MWSHFHLFWPYVLAKSVAQCNPVIIFTCASPHRYVWHRHFCVCLWAEKTFFSSKDPNHKCEWKTFVDNKATSCARGCGLGNTTSKISSSSWDWWIPQNWKKERHLCRVEYCCQILTVDPKRRCLLRQRFLLEAYFWFRQAVKGNYADKQWWGWCSERA